MKTMIRNLSCLAFAGVMLCFARAAFAQMPTETTTTTTISPTETTSTTTTTGTISRFSRNGFAVKTTTSADPLSYSYTKTTTYVDENGAPVEIKTVKSGVPVTVYYTKDGSKMVATKVIVKKTSTISSSPTP